MEAVKFAHGYVSQIDAQFFNFFMFAAFLLMAWQMRHCANWLFLMSIAVAFKAVDVIWINPAIQPLQFHAEWPWRASVYGIYAVYDAALLLLIYYREQIVYWSLFGWVNLAPRLGLAHPGQIFRVDFQQHIAEWQIIFVFGAHIAVNVLAGFEFPYRWTYDRDQVLLYYLFKPLKLGLCLGEIYLFYKVVVCHGREQRSCMSNEKKTID